MTGLWNPAALVFFAACCLLAKRFPAPEKLRSAETPPRRREIILLGVVTLAALAVRVWKFGSVPGGFNQDGAMAAVDAKALADYGTDRYGMRLPAHFTAWGYGQMSVLMSYLMVPFIRLFGLNPVTARLPALLLSLLGLFCLYAFTRAAFGRRAGLTVYAFAAIAPWHILQSRWALDCNLFPHVFLLGLWLLYRGAEGKKGALYAAMAAFGLSMFCYGVALYTVPVFLLAACAWLLASKRVRWRQVWVCAGVYLLVCWPFLLTMAVNFFGWETISLPFVTIPNFPDSVRSGDILLFSGNPAEQLRTNLRAVSEAVIWQGDDLTWNVVPGFGTVYRCSLPFAIAGLVRVWKTRRKSGSALLLLFFAAGLWCGLMTNSVNVNRINLVFYPMIALTGLGLDSVLHRLGKRGWRAAAGGMAAAAYLAIFLCFTATYFGSYADRISVSFMEDFGKAVSAVKDTEAEKLYITADSQYDGARHVSEILTLFYHAVDAKYYQGETPAGERPFREKYVFERMEKLEIDPAENAVYVLKRSDLGLFDPELFRLTDYGRYLVAEPVR